MDKQNITEENALFYAISDPDLAVELALKFDNKAVDIALAVKEKALDIAKSLVDAGKIDLALKVALTDNKLILPVLGLVGTISLNKVDEFIPQQLKTIVKNVPSLLKFAANNNIAELIPELAKLYPDNAVNLAKSFKDKAVEIAKKVPTKAKEIALAVPQKAAEIMAAVPEQFKDFVMETA